MASNAQVSTFPGFTKGEPLPDWQLRDAQGQPTDLKNLCEGHQSLVLCIARPGSPSANQAVKRLKKVGEKQNPPLLRVVILPHDTPGIEVINLDLDGITVTVLCGPEISFNEQKLAWAVSNKAAHIKESGHVKPADIGRLSTFLINAPQSAAESQGGPVSETAPVLIVPDVLDKSLCKRLMDHFEAADFHPSGVLDLSGKTPKWSPDPAVKQRQDLRLEDPGLIRELESTIAARVLPQIRKCFHYVVTHHEPFKLVRYDTGSGYFRPHRDNETPDTDYRRFAMTINLNTGDYDGGAVEFPEFGAKTYRPSRGGAIVFSCSLLHEATDVTRGTRYAVLCFFYNPSDGL